MHFPYIDNIPQSKEVISNFIGLNVNNTAQDNEFKDMKNLSLKDYPYISTRNARKRSNYGFTNIKGILGGDKLYIASTDRFTWIDDDGEHHVSCSLSNTNKKLVKMGKYICIFPDKKIFDGSTVSSMESTFSASSATFTLTDATGQTITYHNASYYDSHTPSDGDYLMTEVNGVSELQRYAKTSGAWYVVTTAFVQITATGIGTKFKAGDGVKITISGSVSWDEGQKLFTETDGEGNRFATYTIRNVSANAITIGGVLKTNKTFSGAVSVKRECPNIAYVTEAMNRLWGCNAEGTEIYACKLGDPTNWNTFEGISTDSWAATVGSHGEFTGAITYLGYPMFFKEDSLIKIAISSQGAHATKETVCRGVQRGCGESLCVVDEILMYKSPSAVMAYDGSLPSSVSDKLGDLTNFTGCIGGRNKSLYYISGYHGAKDVTYVYDGKKGAWSKEADNTVESFATTNNCLYSASADEIEAYDDEELINGTKELLKNVPISFSTRDFDYTTSDAKYVHRLVVKAKMDISAHLDVSIEYNGSGEIIPICSLSAKSKNVYPLSIMPRRCESFRLHFSGKGNVTIMHITKSISEGSDL